MHLADTGTQPLFQQSVSSIYQHVCRLLLVRGRGCRGQHDSAAQGELFPETSYILLIDSEPR